AAFPCGRKLFAFHRAAQKPGFSSLGALCTLVVLSLCKPAIQHSLSLDPMMSTNQGPGTKRRGETAERRQVTALFYDLVGSTLLVAGLDPEDMRSLQQAFHAACTAVITRYG